MASSSAARQTIPYINPDFRLKFVDEENYIERCSEALSTKANKDWKKEKGEGNLIGGEGEEDGIREVGKKVKTEQEERSDDRREQVSRIQLAKPDNSIPDAAHLAPTRRLDMSAMRSGREQIKKQIKKANATRLQQSKSRLLKKPIDWSKLDQVGRPVVSFDPFHESRPRAIRILKRDARDRTRQEIVRKYGVEFSRIYVRYRRDAERRKTGQSYSQYDVRDKEQRACEEAAIQCVLKAVTPRQVLEYWDEKVKDYTNQDLIIPSLNFLKAPSAIDRVACSALGTTGRLEKTKEKRVEIAKIKPENRNTFSGVGGLDIRLRPTLEAAGFPTQAYNDRYLLSIQHNALAIADGKSIFMAEGRVRNMVKHAAKYLYAEV